MLLGEILLPVAADPTTFKGLPAWLRSAAARYREKCGRRSRHGGRRAQRQARRETRAEAKNNDLLYRVQGCPIRTVPTPDTVTLHFYLIAKYPIRAS
jgi:hypothetical protein